MLALVHAGDSERVEKLALLVAGARLHMQRLQVVPRDRVLDARDFGFGLQRLSFLIVALFLHDLLNGLRQPPLLFLAIDGGLALAALHFQAG